MPIVYLGKSDRERRIAEALQRLEPHWEMKEYEPSLAVSNSGIMRINRRRLEEALGESFSDDEWRGLFRRAVGQVVNYDAREYVIEEEPPGEY